MLQSIFSADFDLDRLFNFASASASAAAVAAAAVASAAASDGKSSDSGLPQDDCGDLLCSGGGGGGSGGGGVCDSPELSEAPPLLELRLIVRDACGGVGGGRVAFPRGSSDLVVLTRFEEPVRADLDIRTAHIILSYMEEYLACKEKLQLEWAELSCHECDPNEAIVGAQPENAPKNRYPDRLPYDRTLVSLRGPVPGYINASHVLDCHPRHGGHILTQGPLDSTAGDFWRLVWQCGVTAIVNLTSLTSADTCEELCARYWPERGAHVYGDFEVQLISEHIWCDDCVIRSLRLKNCGNGGNGGDGGGGHGASSSFGEQSRTVTQFHYMSWEELGLPFSAGSLLDFRRKVNKSYRSRNSPVIVHCSDGRGRSGAYCLLDTALNRIARGVKEVNLAATLEHLRDQRPGLVASMEQFEFVFTAVSEEVAAVMRSLPQ